MRMRSLGSSGTPVTVVGFGCNNFGGRIDEEASRADRRRARRGRHAEGTRLLLSVAIGGLLAQPAVASVIAGATEPEQVRANMEAGDWEPSAEQLAELLAL